MDIQATYEQAMALHRAGDFTRAEALYLAILEQDPDQSSAWNLLGILAQQIQMHDVAIELISTAITHAPNTAQYYFNLSNSYHHLNQPELELEALHQAVTLQPDYFEALCNLGNVFYALNRLPAALNCYQRASQVNPGNLEILKNIGNCRRKLGDWQAATACYSQVLSMQEHDKEARFALAKTLRESGQLQAAIAQFRILLPQCSDESELIFEFALTLQESNNIDEAKIYYQLVLALAPDFSEASTNYAVLLINEGEYQQALHQCDLALTKASGPAIYLKKGIALYHLGCYDDSLVCFDQAILLSPDCSECYLNKGTVLHRKGLLNQAYACFMKAVQLDAQYVRAITSIGNVLRDQGKLDWAIQYHTEALEIEPAHQDAWVNLGVTWQQSGNLSEAINCYHHAIDLDPNFADAHWNLSLALLKLGEYARGWKEYEWRWRAHALGMCRCEYTQPVWDGTLMTDQTLLVYAEQGLGDSVQFVRYLPLVAPKVGRLLLACQASLHSMFRRVPGVDAVVNMNERNIKFDRQIAMMSLPHVFDTRLETIPNQVPYLSVDAQSQSKWRHRLYKDQQFRVGLVWAGNPRKQDPVSHLIDQRRSISLLTLAPLFTLPSVSFYSLQLDEGKSEFHSMQSKPNLIDYTDDIKDFSDTAALIANMDLVIGVDTSVVHLAGALAIPVWILSRFDGCWRWLCQRQDSPWYPTARVFYQVRPGGWDEVVAQVRTELARQLQLSLV